MFVKTDFTMISGMFGTHYHINYAKIVPVDITDIYSHMYDAHTTHTHLPTYYFTSVNIILKKRLIFTKTHPLCKTLSTFVIIPYQLLITLSSGKLIVNVMVPEWLVDGRGCTMIGVASDDVSIDSRLITRGTASDDEVVPWLNDDST